MQNNVILLMEITSNRLELYRPEKRTTKLLQKKLRIGTHGCMKKNEAVGKVMIISTHISKVCVVFMSHLPKELGDIHCD